MKRLIWVLAILLVTLSLLGIASIRHLTPASFIERSAASGARFVPTECWFEADDDMSVQCGWMDTAPMPGNIHSSFRLPVVVMHYRGLDRHSDPVVYLAGGPGAPAFLEDRYIEGYWQDWFRDKSGMKRDLILFDQRGSGMSLPELRCESFQQFRTSVLADPGTPIDNAQRYREVTQQCYETLQQRGIALDELGTYYSAQDVHDLMELLDYSQWNLLGVSYGTRLALEIQSRYPQQVRSLSLDSVYPPTTQLLREWPSLLGKSVQRLLDHCDADSLCALENGDLQARYSSLMEQLREQPLVIPVADLNLVELQELHLNDEILLALLFDAQYASHSLGDLADLLRYLQEGQTELAMQLVKNYLRHQFDESFRESVFWAVECRDNPPVSPVELERQFAVFPEMRYYLPPEYDVCDIWNTGEGVVRLSTVSEPRQIPSLILSGRDDPITPTEWAEETALNAFVEHKAHFFSFAGISHGVLDNKRCAVDLLVNFVNDPDQRPRADCRFDEWQDQQIAGSATAG